tara:strand:- start:205 stop:459 length:255 start_codon:yes stop_codon:yes gene_type:complete
MPPSRVRKGFCIKGFKPEQFWLSIRGLGLRKEKNYMDANNSWQQDEFEHERAVESLKKDAQFVMSQAMKLVSDASRMLKQIEAL